MRYRRQIRRDSALVFFLKSLIPYSEANLMLAYKPNYFFNELERLSKYRRNTLKGAYYDAKKMDFVEISDGYLKLTEKGLKEIHPYRAMTMGAGARLIVMFDIPETERSKRQYFRRLLKAWEFQPLQKSIWTTNKDYRELLKEVIDEFGLEEYVEVHESQRIYPSV